MTNRSKQHHSHSHEKKKKPFYRRYWFMVLIIGTLFYLAFHLKGEHFTLMAFGARLIDAVGDVITDMTIKGE